MTDAKYSTVYPMILGELNTALACVSDEEIDALIKIITQAHKLGAKVVHIGSNPNSGLKDICCLMVRIPVQTKNYLDDEINSQQPMTSLFEQSLLLLGDAVAKVLIERSNIDMKQLWRFHANLE